MYLLVPSLAAALLKRFFEYSDGDLIGRTTL